MLVEAAWVAVRTPGPLRAFYERIRSRRGMQIAVVATARKLAVLCWHLVIKDEDYAFGRPSLTEKKLRALELRAGMPARRGKKGNAAAHNLTDVRRRELELSEQAEHAYRQLVADWQAKRPQPESGRGRRQWDATEKALSGASCAAGLSPRTCASLRGRPRPEQSLTPTQPPANSVPPRDEDIARPHAATKPIQTRFRRRPCRRATPSQPPTSATSTENGSNTALKFSRGLDTFIRHVERPVGLRRGTP